MGFNTRVQCIKRKKGEQWYVNLPSALAQAMEFAQSESVEWLVEAKDLLALRRPEAPAPVLKKTRLGSSSSSSSSGKDAVNSANSGSRAGRRRSP